MTLRTAQWLSALLLGLATALSAQTTPQTFTSPDGMFRFDSGPLVRCTEEEKQHHDGFPGWWVPRESCGSFIPVCDDSSTPGSTTIVCFAYPRKLIVPYDTPVTATFSVSEIKRVVSEEACLTGSPGWVYSPPERGQIVTIKHLKFRFFNISDLATGHFLEGREYRSFHENKCYELSIRKTWTNTWAILDPPPKQLTQQESNELTPKLEQPLKHALDSFGFLK